MGQEVSIVCRDCETHETLGKLWIPETEFPEHADLLGRIDEGNSEHVQTLLRFVFRHEGHNISLVGEYGGTQAEWMDLDH